MDSRYARVTRGIVFSRTAVGLHRSYLAANPTRHKLQRFKAATERQTLAARLFSYSLFPFPFYLPSSPFSLIFQSKSTAYAPPSPVLPILALLLQKPCYRRICQKFNG